MTSKYVLSYHQKMKLQDVFDLYEDRLRLVELKIKDLFQNNIPFISPIADYIFSSGGKRLRPLFHLISADLSGYKGATSLEIAGIIETIHTASLLHDDVVDTAEIRRGRSTANSLWGNQIVILVGDFLYSNALKCAVMQKNQRIMEALSAATTRMTEGELLQLNRVGDPEITEDEYNEIISAKTGALFSAACRVGGILAELPDEQENALAQFGMKSGRVFQMADDILDYMSDTQQLGKKLCKDLDEGKITLPLLYLLNVASVDEISEIRNLIKEGFSENGLKRLMDLFRKYDSINASFQKAQTLLEEAKEELAIFPDSQPKEALFTIANYALYREK